MSRPARLPFIARTLMPREVQVNALMAVTLGALEGGLLGVIVKTVPQINVLIVGFPIKIAVGLITLGAGLVFYRTVVMSMFEGLQEQLAGLLLAMS